MQRRTMFAAAGLLAIGVCLTVSIPAAAQGYPGATAPQLRACRTEADRRLGDYTYDQIQVESESRDQNVAQVRWWAGNEGGRCTVATNGRVLAFTREINAGGAGAGGGNGFPGTSTRLTCESRGTKRQECPIPAGARVRLVRQTSVNECRLNDTYGQGLGYLWVAEGCRGEFEITTPGQVGGGGPGGVTRITCASPVNGRQECPIAAGMVARFVGQASNQPCRENNTYGTKPGAVWVQRGCQAIFEVTPQGGAGGGNGGTYTTRLVCESQGAQQQRCPIAGATSVRLIKQYSVNACRLNETFGIGFGHLWVSNGCRGEFELTVGGGNAGPGYPGPGAGPPGRVTCASDNGQRTECRIRNGAQVQLVKQLSTAACVRNSTWGTGVGVLWVTKGCRGEFEVR